MHLTREAIDAWAAAARFPETGRNVTIRLEEGDSMVASVIGVSKIEGPAIVELVVYRDGGWSARELTYETVESIALAASLAQRTAPNGRALCNYGHTMADHEAAGACVRPIRVPSGYCSCRELDRPETTCPVHGRDPLPMTPERIEKAAQRQPPCACDLLGHRLGGPILHERTAACP